MEQLANEAIEPFCDLLTRSSLVDEQVMKIVRANLPKAKSIRHIAGWMVSNDWLTRWQANQLLMGRENFFFGKYKLLEQIGEGGMGSVFRAQQGTLGRSVALKILSHELVSNPVSVARFQREVRASAALNHPNVVAVYDADCFERTHFLVLEYVPGMDVRRWLRRKEVIPVSWACECIFQAALGLEHIHEKGLVHRDIKPGNILVVFDDAGRPEIAKLLDLGLARATREKFDDEELTQTGQVLGTVDYISPEQVEDTSGADIRSDVFSLGCTFYKLLTGEIPFPGKTSMEKLLARTRRPPARPSEHRAEIPYELDEIVLKMIRQEAERRFQTPAEFAAAIEPFTIRQGRTGRIRPEELTEPVRAAENSPPEAEPAADGPATVSPPVEEEELTLLPLDHESSSTATQIQDSQKQGKRSDPADASRSYEEAFCVTSPDDYQAGGIQSITAARGGQFAASSSDRLVQLWNLADGKEISRLLNHSQEIECVAISDNGRLLASGGWDQKVCVWDLESRQLLRQLNGHTDGVWAVLFARNNRHVISAGRDRSVRVWDLTAGKMIRWLEHSDWVRDLALSPDGRYLLLGGGGGAVCDYTVRMWDLGTSQELRVLKGHTAQVRQVCFSPDGMRAASCGEDSTLRLWDLYNGTEARRMNANGVPLYCANFSRNGEQLITGAEDGRVRIWGTATGQLADDFAAHRGAIVSLTVLRTGAGFLTGGTDQHLRLWRKRVKKST